MTRDELRKRSPVPLEQRDAYAALLISLMTEQKVTAVRLAEMVGVHPASIANYRSSLAFPSPTISAAIADALMSTKLRELGTWRVPCAVCKTLVEAISRGGHAKMYCSALCRGKRHQQKEMLHPRRRRAKAKVYRVNVSLRHENGRFRDTLRKHCLDCAGETRLCPLLDGCVWIPLTELRKAS